MPEGFRSSSADRRPHPIQVIKPTRGTPHTVVAIGLALHAALAALCYRWSHATPDLIPRLTIRSVAVLAVFRSLAHLRCLRTRPPQP
ncbi:hypothetical protein Scel_05610 [Streptomyces cellostaticus]|nr:hypothetical protein Scel_05610 [Streptomyces cellostaticus]